MIFETFRDNVYNSPIKIFRRFKQYNYVIFRISGYEKLNMTNWLQTKEWLYKAI